MTFRWRLMVGLAVAGIVPLFLVGVGARREMARRLSAQADARVAALVEVIEGDFARDGQAIRARLASLTAELANDNRFRRTARDPAPDREWTLEWASGAMRAAGLVMLQLQDEHGRILSSGHFRNEYDRLEPTLPTTLIGANTRPTLVEARAPEGPFLVFAAVDSVSAAGRRFTLLGGLALDSARLATMSRGELRVAIAASEADCANERPPNASVPIAGCRPSGTVATIPMTLVTGGSDPRLVDLVIVGDLTAVPTLLASLDRWLFLAAALALALAVAVAAVLGRTLSAPLAELAERAEALDLDRLDRIFTTGRSDEIGALEDSMSRMTQRLGHSVDALRAAERRAATGDLARQINHDVKNGLVPIRNVLRHLSEVAEHDPPGLATIYAERRGTLESSIDYLDQLARNYARLAPALTRQACDVNALARAVTAAAARPGIDITTRLDPTDPAIRADPIAVRRVLENLVTNASDSIAGGHGRVEVRTECTGDRRTVRITVSDTGRGMTREELDLAFGDFYTTKPDGTGLGLSVVRRLVADLDGSLRVETAPGEGSRFFLEVPSA